MSKVSIIIPCRNETYLINGMTVLERTIKDIYEKATGDFEVIVAFDGEPYIPLPGYKNLTILNLPQQGTKPILNIAVGLAKGKYIIKTDAHCMFDKGFDEILQTGVEDNWVVTPRFYTLNAEEWCWQDEKFCDYFFLPCPFTDRRLFRFQAGGYWRDRTSQRLDIAVDENMKTHGSFFFMSKEFYVNCLGGLHSEGAGTWSGEDIEISNKTWLGPWDGKLIVNKNTWYAHMHKGGQRPRGWSVSKGEIERSYLWTANYWMKDSWEDRKNNLEWLIEKFSPVPTWPDNWKELWKEYKENE